MALINTFNKAIPNAINKYGKTYETIIGAINYDPESTIEESSDFNCGALCNELEYLKTVSQYYVRSFDIDSAETDTLEELVTALIDLPRRGNDESDESYRNRFRAVAVAKTNFRRTTKWAITDSISYFIPGAITIKIVEPFSDYNLYFQVRIRGAQDTDNALVLDSPLQSYVNQYYVGGIGVGDVISYLGEIVDRIKAAGVDYDILFVDEVLLTKTISATIGSVQIYYTMGATIKQTYLIDKTSNAEVI